MAKHLDDPVHLKVCLFSNTLWLTMHRQGAMNLIKDWFLLRESTRSGSTDSSKFLAEGTVAGAILNKDSGDYLADHWAIAWSSVLAMQILEIELTPIEELAKAQKKLMDKMTEEGEEWKQDDDSDEEF